MKSPSKYGGIAAVINFGLGLVFCGKFWIGVGAIGLGGLFLATMRIGRGCLALLLFALVGCSDELGKTPYVPGNGYSCTVAISVTNQAVVGERVPLQASRTSGPWVQVPRAQVTNLAAAYPTAPPGLETNVQAELTWQTDSPGVARFNVATLQSVSTNPYGREVVFSQPGVYRIWAINGYPTLATSAVQTITVRAKQ